MLTQQPDLDRLVPGARGKIFAIRRPGHTTHRKREEEKDLHKEDLLAWKSGKLPDFRVAKECLRLVLLGVHDHAYLTLRQSSILD